MSTKSNHLSYIILNSDAGSNTGVAYRKSHSLFDVTEKNKSCAKSKFMRMALNEKSEEIFNGTATISNVRTAICPDDRIW